MRRYFISLRSIELGAALLLALAFLGPLGAQGASVNESALVSLYVNGISSGDVEIFVEGDGSILLPSVLLRRSLQDIARSEIITALAGGEGFVGRDQLGRFGITADYDAANLALALKVPASAMPVVEFATQSSSALPLGLVLAPEAFSAILGLSCKVDSTMYGVSTLDALNPDASLALTPTLNILGWVAEGQVDLNWKSAYSASLGYARVVKDFPKGLTRLSAGLVDTRSRSFQSGLTLLGLAAGREPRLRDGKRPPSDALEEFVIEEPADITIGLNGVVIKRSRLQPGSYRLSDLAMASGVNDIVIGIHEAGKADRTIRRSLPWDGNLLPAGDFDWYAAAGVERDRTDSPFGTGYASWGLTRTLSAGLDLQAGLGGLLGGGLASWATAVGTFSTAFDLSHSWEAPFALALPGYALSLNWQFQIPGVYYAPRLGLGAEYRGGGFSVPTRLGDAVATGAAGPLNLTMQLGQSLPGGGALALMGSSALDELGWSTVALSLGYFQALPGSVSLSVSMGGDLRRGAALDPSLSIAISAVPPDRRTLQYHYDLMKARDSVSLSLPLGSGVESGLSAREENLLGGAETAKVAAFGLHGPLGFLDLSADVAYARDSTPASEQVKLGGSASTALAFAGGRFGISRSIGDSFAFLVPDSSIGGQRVELRPTGSSSATTSIGGRSEIIPNLTSYLKTGVGIDMPESPPEISPAVTAVVLSPTYRSGTVIRVSVKRSYMVYGRLKGADGKAVAEAFGDVFSTSGEAL
ncbi:MAG: hypothetical protein WCL50_07475, partial [Spirochaetota bacterium]